MLYDYLLTLPDEVEEIWKGRFTITRVLYLMNRYPFMISLLTFIIFIYTSMGDAVSFFDSLFLNALILPVGVSLFKISDFSIYVIASDLDLIV